jgi:hypothetical protein
MIFSRQNTATQAWDHMAHWEAKRLVHGADHTGIEGADDVRNRDRLALPRPNWCPNKRLF